MAQRALDEQRREREERARAAKQARRQRVAEREQQRLQEIRAQLAMATPRVVMFKSATQRKRS